MELVDDDFLKNVVVVVSGLLALCNYSESELVRSVSLSACAVNE